VFFVRSSGCALFILWKEEYKMKRILTLFLVLITALSLCACGTDFTDDISSTNQTTLANTFPANEYENTFDETQTPTEIPTTTPTTAPTEAPATKPQHTHEYSAATCTAPKKCSCGATQGKANGHKWKAATCSSPKTCTVCGTKSGLTAGHNFSNGKCKTCGKADPDYQAETMVWIPTRGGTKYHTHAGCSNMDDPEKVTQSEAESRGFTPCKRCH
jgi:predicted small secreted protein